MLKLNPKEAQSSLTGLPIQIQHLLKLNFIKPEYNDLCIENSNTTFVKVKFKPAFLKSSTSHIQIQHLLKLNILSIKGTTGVLKIQIQHLLKLNLNNKNSAYDGFEFKYNIC